MPPMGRLKKGAILATLVRSLRSVDSWCGETHIQKVVFFLQELTGVPLGFRFVLYHYGPFSFDLREDLIGLRAESFLGIEVYESYGPRYRLRARASLLRKGFPKTLERFNPEIDFVVAKLGGANAAKLERVATALYIRLNEPHIGSVKDRAHKLVQYKPHIQLEIAIRAVQECDSICNEWTQKATENRT